MAFNRNPPLEERIATLRKEIDAFIDARAAHIKETCEGVPVDVIRNLVTRGTGCQCSQYLQIKKEDDEAAALRAQQAAEGTAA